VIFFTGQGVGRQEIALLDPQWLYERTQEHDLADGLADWATFGTDGIGLVEHPERAGRQVLHVARNGEGAPFAAVRNFPSGIAGELRLKLRINPGCGGALVALTDHFSVPFDWEDHLNSVFNLWIDGEGRMEGSTARVPFGRWVDLMLEWDCRQRRDCRILLDGKEATRLPQLKQTVGACYFRLRCTAKGTDSAGFFVECARVILH
jgi:hypothetical protein